MNQEIKILATKPDDLSAALGFSRFLPCFPVAVINAMTKTNLGRKGISSYSLYCQGKPRYALMAGTWTQEISSDHGGMMLTGWLWETASLSRTTC